MPNKMFEYLEKYFFSKFGLIIGYLIITLIMTSINSLLKEFISDVNIRLVFFILSLILYSIIWYKLNYSIPRLRSKSKISVILSFTAESDKLRMRIQEDINNKVRDMICQSSLQKIIDVITPKSYEVRKINLFLKGKINNNLKLIKKAEKFINQNPYSIIVWGNLVERSDSENMYLINFNIVAKHSKISSEISERLSREMRILLPTEIRFLTKEEYKGLNATKEMLYLSIRYITGVVLYLSLEEENLEAAYYIHKDLLNILQGKNTPLYNEIIIQYKKLYGAELYYMSNKSFDNGDIEESLSYSDMSLTFLPESYEVIIRNGYLNFHVNRNIEKAIYLFEKASKFSNNDYLWLYNKAFLLIYQGKFNESLHTYDYLVAKKFDGEEDIIEQCINYNLHIANVEKDKLQCFFIVGYLYYKKLNNYPMAFKYFDSFHQQTNKKRGYEVLKKRSRKYLNNIQKFMDSTNEAIVDTAHRTQINFDLLENKGVNSTIG